MKNYSLLTEDGYLILDNGIEPIHNKKLDVPQIKAIMRLENTSDTLRGVLNDLIQQNQLTDGCCLIGRSGHSQVGLDVELGDEAPTIDTSRRLIDVPIIITSLNRTIPDILFSILKGLVEEGKYKLNIGRLFIPMSDPLSKEEIEEAVCQHHLLLPQPSVITGDGVIELPLENVRYLLSGSLLKTGQNARNVLLYSKGGLGLMQHLSYSGIPKTLHPKEFFVGAIKISLGPYLAVIDRELNDNSVFHLAARILDAVRTSGINVLRQIEIYNSAEAPATLADLRIRIRLYRADPTTSEAAERIFSRGNSQNVIKYGVSFSDATGIYNTEICQSLFDNLSTTQAERGGFARVLSRTRVVEIPREIESGEWHERIQNRFIFEVATGNITSGEHRGEQIPQDLRPFVDGLQYVGGEQDLRQVYVSHHLPATGVIQALKRNNVGVFVGRSIRYEKENQDANNIYFDQTTYESLYDLERNAGMRFYLLMGDGDDVHVRGFYRGLWVVKGCEQKLKNTHTVIAMYGSHVDGTEDILTEQIYTFLSKVKKLPELEGHMAICHGSGPGVMRIADRAAEQNDLLRIGVGIDSEKIGQLPNLRPPAIVCFRNSARHLRQNFLDRISLFKIYNIGGIGTLEELLIAVTNLKLSENLPAPHIFVDPFGLGGGGDHIWMMVIKQLGISCSPKEIGGNKVHLSPDWIPKFCHLVSSYEEAFEIIKNFVGNPLEYWRKTGMPEQNILAAYDNARYANINIPPYIEKAILKIGSAK